ncbi:protein immune deficiency-like [Haliotis rufescens]|uniref:protein immune deficiency-like n=1 Tax=Haliotis rufescens TaxID=6454 RepID=UPI001EB09F4E|nr:protein immune deficiency-like [Haliotis rufescens]XP_048254859.1 protein immune deficiency-like [Haliotis rufescens]
MSKPTMPENVETDASAEMPGACGGTSSSSSSSGNTNAYINYTGPDGTKFNVRTTGKAPNLQIGYNNVMHVTENSLLNPKRPRLRPMIEPKLPLVKSSEVPGPGAMEVIACNIGKDWKYLGRALGLTDGELDNIRIDYYPEGQYEICYQTVRKWKEQAFPTELRRLAKCCAKIGRGDVADKLAKMKQEGNS